MFKVKTKEEIGKYLSELIEREVNAEKYKSKRQFCKEYSKLYYNIDSPNDTDIHNMECRFKDIISGKNAVQMEDYPVLTELLGVSCEQILTAGSCSAPISDRPTNYTVANSRDETAWEKYVNNENKLILNYDEYGKSVIDYAFEFKNYGFLKYLTDKGYIWFVGRDSNDYTVNFQAGTSIKRRELDVMEYRMRGNDNLRTNMAALAMENEDFAMLDELHARETPQLYFASRYFGGPNESECYKNERLIKAISKSSGKVLEYFCDEFEIEAQASIKNLYIFPYIGDTAELMLKNNNNNAEKLLEAVYYHNKRVYKKLQDLIEAEYNVYMENVEKSRMCKFTPEEYEAVKENLSKIPREKEEQTAKNTVLEEIYLFDNNSIVRFYGRNLQDGINANIIYINATAKKEKLNRLVEKANNSYEKIVNNEFFKDV